MTFYGKEEGSWDPALAGLGMSSYPIRLKPDPTCQHRMMFVSHAEVAELTHAPDLKSADLLKSPSGYPAKRINTRLTDSQQTRAVQTFGLPFWTLISSSGISITKVVER